MEFVRAELGRPFIWSETNCVALALRAIDAMHGTRLHATHRHHMCSALRAQAWTRQFGPHGIIVELLKDGLSEIPVSYAQPGDILAGETDDGQIAAHICLGVRVLSSTQNDGVIQLRLTDIAPKPIYAAGWRGA